MAHPNCGLYKTTKAFQNIEAGRLVYFHNHGNPGAGVYLPKSWSNNLAIFHEQGTTLEDESYSSSLVALLPEGLYVVEKAFTCCNKNCRTYEKDALVQLGYNGEAGAILFVPTLGHAGMTLAPQGTKIDTTNFGNLRALKVARDKVSQPKTIH